MRSPRALAIVFVCCVAAGMALAVPNPAAVYCRRLGYQYKQVVTPRGVSAVVEVAPGVEFDAWDFFRGKVGSQYHYGALHGYRTECAVRRAGSYIEEYAICIPTNPALKGASAIPLLDLMARNGEPLLAPESDLLRLPASGRAVSGKRLSDFGGLKGQAPASFDWRDVSGRSYIGPVRDQGECGSCYAFAACAAAEVAFNYVEGMYGAGCADFSESFIIWTLGRMSPYGNHFFGCNGSDSEYAELDAWVNEGVCYESAFPYTETDPGGITHTEDPRERMTSWARIDCGDVEAMKIALMTYGALDAAVYVDTDFQWYSGGVFTNAMTNCPGEPECYYTPVNHAIALVGWDDDAGCWILRNSWGPRWGEQGYMRIGFTSARVSCAPAHFTYVPPPPSPPSGLSASDGAYSDRVALTWTAAPKARRYQVLRSHTYNYGDASMVTQTTATSYSDYGAAPLTIQYYWVRSVSGGGTSAPSAMDFGFRTIGTPGGLAASDGTYADKVRLTWNSVSGATSYEVWRGTTTNSGAASLLAETAAAAYDDTSATPGHSYYYWVKAKGRVVASLPVTSPFSAVESGWRGMSAPTGVAASDGSFTDKVRVGWNSASGATGYEVWRASVPDVNGAVKISGTGLSASPYDDTTPVPGITYFYWVRALAPNGASEFSAYDSGWRARTDVPAAPTGVAATQGTYTNKIRVTWNAVSGASAYEVWRAPGYDLGSAMWIADTVGTRYDDFDVPVGIVFAFWIKAKNSGGASPLSDPATGYRSPGAEPPDPPVPPKPLHVLDDYNGDALSDLAVVRSVDSTWYVRTLAGGAILYGQAFGLAGMTPVPGDFDGDNRTDLAVYDSAWGNWYIATIVGLPIVWGDVWGGAGFLPVYGDFDGDGKADMGVYDQATGSWYVRSAAGGILVWAMQMGGPGMAPVPGDYNGDGSADLAVYDPALGLWYAATRGANIITWGMAWGGPEFAPVMGDYDGDKIADLAVYSQASGVWFIRSLAGNLIAWSVHWGGPGLSPVPGDFDGDGRSDLAVYNSQTGLWFIRTVSGVILAWGAEWGGPGFAPVRP